MKNPHDASAAVITWCIIDAIRDKMPAGTSNEVTLLAHRGRKYNHVNFIANVSDVSLCAKIENQKRRLVYLYIGIWSGKLLAWYRYGSWIHRFTRKISSRHVALVGLLEK